MNWQEIDSAVKEFALQVDSVRCSLETIKSDDVVDDDQCDSAAASLQELVRAFNRVMKEVAVDERYTVRVPENLEASFYQQEYDCDFLD